MKRSLFLIAMLVVGFLAGYALSGLAQQQPSTQLLTVKFPQAESDAIKQQVKEIQACSAPHEEKEGAIINHAKAVKMSEGDRTATLAELDQAQVELECSPSDRGERCTIDKGYFVWRVTRAIAQTGTTKQPETKTSGQVVTKVPASPKGNQ